MTGGFLSIQEALDFAIHGRTLGIRHNALRRAEVMAARAWRQAIWKQQRQNAQLVCFGYDAPTSYETIPSTSPYHPGGWTGD